MKKDSKLHDPFAFLDEQPEPHVPAKHTPESLRKRCQELLNDADGVVPGMRIIGLFGMKDPMFCQLAENEFCNHMMSYLSEECAGVARDTDYRRIDDELSPKGLEDDMPTMDELDSEKDDILG
jgi:hypothetical protein